MKYAIQLFILLVVLFFANLFLFSEEYNYSQKAIDLVNDIRFRELNACILSDKCERDYFVDSNQDLTEFLESKLDYNINNNVIIHVYDSLHLEFHFHNNDIYSLETLDQYDEMHDQLNQYVNEYYSDLNRRFEKLLDEEVLKVDFYVHFQGNIKLRYASIKHDTDYQLMFPYNEFDIETQTDELADKIRIAADVFESSVEIMLYSYDEQINLSTTFENGNFRISWDRMIISVLDESIFIYVDGYFDGLANEDFENDMEILFPDYEVNIDFS